MIELTPTVLAVGEALREGMIGLAGNLFIGVLALTSVAYLLKREMTQFLGFLASAVLIGTIIYASDQWVALFEGVGELIS